MESLLPDFDFFQFLSTVFIKINCVLLQPENFLPEFNCLAVLSSDNPDFFDGHCGHRGVARFWHVKFNDFITTIHIDSDRFVRIKFSPSKENTFHLLFVYLPASSHPLVDFQEVLDLLWGVCDTCFQDGPVFTVGNFNADLGDSIGLMGTYQVTDHGKLLLEFIHNFNMSPANLASLARGLLFTFWSENGEHQSVIDYILVPNLFLNRIIASSTSGQLIIYRIMCQYPWHFDCEVALPAHVDPVQGLPSCQAYFLG